MPMHLPYVVIPVQSYTYCVKEPNHKPTQPMIKIKFWTRPVLHIFGYHENTANFNIARNGTLYITTLSIH